TGLPRGAAPPITSRPERPRTRSTTIGASFADIPQSTTRAPGACIATARASSARAGTEAEKGEGSAMPENSTGQIAVYQDLSAVAKFTFSPQVTGVRLRKIPAGTSTNPVGTFAVLPGEPSDGDNYELEDTDGSCDIDNANVVAPDPHGTATVGGLGAFPLFSPFAGGRFTFDAEANNWVVALTGNVALTG